MGHPSSQEPEGGRGRRLCLRRAAGSSGSATTDTERHRIGKDSAWPGVFAGPIGCPPDSSALRRYWPTVRPAARPGYSAGTARGIIEVSGDAAGAPRDMEAQMTAHAGDSGMAATSTRTTTPEPLYGGHAPRRITVRDIAAAKARGERWPMLTAYDALTARVFADAGIPRLLLADSAGMVVYGHDTTIPVTVDELIPLTAAVVRGTSRAMVVADLPCGSYQGSPAIALSAATRFLKEAGAPAVKLEGGHRVLRQVGDLRASGS